MRIDRLRSSDTAALVAASHLFDNQTQPNLSADFLQTEGNHCFIAYIDNEPVGFITGIEAMHPDKHTEMLLFELGVEERFRRRGVGRSLVEALRRLSEDKGHRGMWVSVEPDDEAAMRTYLAAGASPPQKALLLSWDFHIRT